jgi:hypothetical protein
MTSKTRPGGAPRCGAAATRAAIKVSRRCITVAAVVSGLLIVPATLDPRADADPAAPPSSDQVIRPLPVIVAKPTNWTPKFPFPYDQTRNRVTGADIHAEAEMCQWYTAQYQIINDQIDRLQFNRIGPNGEDGDYSVNGIQQQVDIVTTNIDQSLDYLAPRAQALTQNQDFAGDNYFPLYEGQAFYGLWQQLANVNDGIKAHQPDWFTGPSYRRLKRLASEINRSHVCDS